MASKGKVELDEQDEDDRFFGSQTKKAREQPEEQRADQEAEEADPHAETSNAVVTSRGGEGGAFPSESSEATCLTLRLLQSCIPCFRPRAEWEPSQTDVFKEDEKPTDEVRYPTALKVLDSAVTEFIFVLTSLLSVMFLFFSEGFILESRVLWGIIHFNNCIYTACVFGVTLELLIKSLNAKTRHNFYTKDTVYLLVSVIPVDIVVLVVHMLSENQTDLTNPITNWITISRIFYFFRLRNVTVYFQKWEDQLALGDIAMFLIRILVYGIFLLHLIACFWHRIACEPFTLAHLKITPSQATVDVCIDGSWVTKLLKDKNDWNRNSPLFQHKWNVITEHYLVCIYWAIVTVFRLGASDITASLVSDWEVAFTSFTQIMAWIFLVVYIGGSLTSLLVEMDTEKENFMTRRFAIRKYLEFSDVSFEIKRNVNRFYDYLWVRSRGIHNWDLIDTMPTTMKAEVFYNINKYVMEQLPILANLEPAFLTNLSTHVKHQFLLRGEILQRRGQNGYAMFYVINGYLEVLDDDEVTVLTEIRSGSAIGEICLVQSYPVICTVRCGSECDLLILERGGVKQTVEMYPEYKSILQQRIDTRLEQASLLVSLCERHNEHEKWSVRLQKKLKEEGLEVEFGRRDYKAAYEQIISLLSRVDDDEEDEGEDDEEKKKKEAEKKEGEGMTEAEKVEREKMKEARLRTRVSQSHPLADVEKPMTLEEIRAAYSLALENDVGRANSLSRDLEIPKPPMNARVPAEGGGKGHASQPWSPFMIPTLIRFAVERHGLWRLWKLVVSICALFVVWYYPYCLGFKEHEPRNLMYISHLFDFVFAVDFVLDMTAPIVLPLKTLENLRDIGRFRVRTFYFYFRLISFLPLEYILGPMFSLHPTTGCYCFLKLNRLIQYIEVFKFFKMFETDTRVSPELLYIIKFGVRFFYLMHLFAVAFEISLKGPSWDCYKNATAAMSTRHKHFYEYPLYWATEIVSGTGFGDLPLDNDRTITITVIGLIIGTSIEAYFVAKIAAIIANNERRRVYFKQRFFCLKAFMKERRFDKSVRERVCRYYDLQWRRHEGALIPQAKNAIWDAPRTLLESVSFAQAEKYVTRIPLFMECPELLIIEICAALRQYIVPPRETLLYENDKSRDLYILVKGYCKVTRGGEVVGKLGPGNYFGISGLMFGVNRPYRIETVNYVQFFCLEFSSFMDIARRYIKFFQEYKWIRGDDKVLRKIPRLTPQNWQIFPAEPDDLISSTSTASIVLSTAGSTPVIPTPTIVANEPVATEEPHPEQPEEKLSKKSDPKGFWEVAREKLHQFFIEPIIPHGTFLQYWTIFRVLSAFIIGNFVLVQSSFSVKPSLSFGFVLCFDIIAWIDMYLCFRVGYFGHKSQLIVNRADMAKHYLKGPFALDLLGCIPLDLLVIICTPGVVLFGPKSYYGHHYYVVSALRLNRLLQCYRLFVSGSLLAKKIYRSLSLLILLQVVPIMILFLNVMNCIAVKVVCSVSRDGEAIKCQQHKWIVNPDGELYHDSPYTADKIMEDATMSYMIGLYFIMSSAFCVGFGDIRVMDDPTSRQITTIVIYLGVLITGYLVGKLTACLVGEDSRRVALREKTKVMMRYLDQFRIPKDIKRRAREYYYGAWDRTKGILPSELFSTLHPSLKGDTMNTLYEETLKKSPVFSCLPEDGLRLLASKLQEKYYPEGEFIFEYGDLDGDMYFIAKGMVATYTDRGVIVNYVGSGSIIGEISCLFEIQRQFTSVAATDVEIFLFKKMDFLDFLSLYPEVREKMEQACARHYKETMESRSETNVPDPIIIVEEPDNEDEEAPPQQQRGARASFLQTTLEFNKDKHKSLTAKGVEVELGSAIEMSRGELDEHPEFIDDPLRLPGTRDEEETMHKPRNVGSWRKRWATYFLTFGRVPRDEMGLIHIVQDRDKVKCKRLVIHPLSPICSHVTFFLFITSLSCGLTAYEIAFHDEKEESGTLLTMRCTLEVFFILRIIGSFFQGFYDKYGMLVAEPGVIVKRYLKSPTGFALDFITTFPFYFFPYLTTSKSWSAYQIAPDIRGLQLLRVILFARYLKETETELRMKLSQVKLVKMSILLCFIFHFCACCWYIVACDGMQCSRGSWLTIVAKDLINFAKIQSEDDIKIGSRYLLSLYYVATAITFTGLSDITPRTEVELLATCAMVFTTVFLIGFLVGEMTQCLASQVKTKIHFRHKVDVMENHFLALGLAKPKMKVVRQYYRLMWLRCNGNPFTKILSELPYSLRADIAMKIYGPCLKNSKIIGKLDDVILRQLCACIRHETFMPRAHIIRTGEVCTSVYFIKSGEVVVLDESGTQELCIDVLYENECFGEVKVLLGAEQFRFSYVARLETEIGVLAKDDLLEVVERHQGRLDDMVERANRAKEQRLREKGEETLRRMSSVSSVGDEEAFHRKMSVAAPEGSGPGIRRTRKSAIFGKGASSLTDTDLLDI